MKTINNNRQLYKILKNKPNSITLFRLLLLFVSILIFTTSPEISCLILMLSVILDYFDGIIARKYKQCTFFGHCFDWLVDINSSILMFIWWAQLQPQFTIIFIVLILCQISLMAFDITAHSQNYSPKIQSNQLLTYILKITMKSNSEGYCCQGLGYVNTINYYLCGMARILYLKNNQSNLWLFMFYVNLPAAISYVLMNIGYTKILLDHWNQKVEGDEKIMVSFKND